MKDLRNYSLLPHNTFGIEARCDRFLEYASADEAVDVARILRQSATPYIIIGAGSNLLLTGDYHGTVIHSACRGITIDGTLVRCASGETWDDVVSTAIANRLYGMENLSLIPGDVGASAVQNIGAYGVEACDVIERIEAVEIASGKRIVIEARDCHYGYRQSRFKGEWKNRFLITAVCYRLSDVFEPRLDYGNIRVELEQRGIKQPTAHELRRVIIDIRQAKLPDPAVLGNAGSFFMNPVVSRATYERLAQQYPQMPHYTIDADREKIPAGWLIEQAGWKGRHLGPAAVSDRQALVLVNTGGATGADIVSLCQAVRHDVEARFGIVINPEVNIV